MWFQNKRAAVRKRLGPEAPRAAGSPRTKYKNASDSNSCFYCDLCPAAFIAQAFLKRHKEYHQIQTYACRNCKSVFTHPDLLLTHTKARCKNSVGGQNGSTEGYHENTVGTTNSPEGDVKLESKRLCLPTVLNVPNPQVALNLTSTKNNCTSSSIYPTDLTSTVSAPPQTESDSLPNSLDKPTDSLVDPKPETFERIRVSGNLLSNGEQLEVGGNCEDEPSSTSFPCGESKLMSALTASSNHSVAANGNVKREYYPDDSLAETEVGDEGNTNSVGNQIVQQIFMNHVKQQQKQQQTEAIKKLTEYYLQQLQQIKRNGSDSDDGSAIDDIKLESGQDVDMNNHLQYGNLTIFPLKCKTNQELLNNQPIDLSSRKSENSNDSLENSGETNNSVDPATSNFHQNILQILMNQLVSRASSASENEDGSAKSINSSVLPYLLNVLSNQQNEEGNNHQLGKLNSPVNLISALQANSSLTTTQEELKQKALLGNLLSSLVKKSEVTSDDIKEAFDGDCNVIDDTGELFFSSLTSS